VREDTMMQHRRNLTLTLVAGFVLISSSSDSVQNLTAEEQIVKQCAITKAKVSAAYFKCLTRAAVKGIKQRPSEDVVQLVAQCKAKHSNKFEKAEARAVNKGGQCVTTDNASSVRSLRSNFR
jgi:hypothetical protein